MRLPLLLFFCAMSLQATKLARRPAVLKAPGTTGTRAAAFGRAEAALMGTVAVVEYMRVQGMSRSIKMSGNSRCVNDV